MAKHESREFFFSLLDASAKHRFQYTISSALSESEREGRGDDEVRSMDFLNISTPVQIVFVGASARPKIST